MSDDRRNGLSFWQVVFIMALTMAGLVAAIETGNLEPHFWPAVEKSFDNYNRSFPHGARLERACGKPITLEACPALVDYDREFLTQAAQEAKENEKRIPHLLQMLADWRTYRRAARGLE